MCRSSFLYRGETRRYICFLKSTKILLDLGNSSSWAAHHLSKSNSVPAGVLGTLSSRYLLTSSESNWDPSSSDVSSRSDRVKRPPVLRRAPTPLTVGTPAVED